MCMGSYQREAIGRYMFIKVSVNFIIEKVRWGGRGVHPPPLEMQYANIFCKIFAKVSIKNLDVFHNFFLKYFSLEIKFFFLSKSSISGFSCFKNTYIYSYIKKILVLNLTINGCVLLPKSSARTIIILGLVMSLPHSTRIKSSVTLHEKMSASFFVLTWV